MRIQKYLSEQGICSRREAENYIKQGLIKVNGHTVTQLGTQINPAQDKLEISETLLNKQEAKTTIILNKPRGYVSSAIKREGKNVFELLPQPYQSLNIVGRLDKASEGLLLLSDDGSIAALVTGDQHLIEKEYEVIVREPVTPGKLSHMAKGLILEDGPTLPAKTQFTGKNSFKITLKEGRKHQIRRMCEAMHLTVLSLKRLRIGPLTLKGLASGNHRKLTNTELSELRNSANQ